MTVKDLTCENYKTLQTDLLQNAHRNPYCPIYEKKLSVDGECYRKHRTNAANKS